MTHIPETGTKKLALASGASVIRSGAEFFWRQILESDRTCSIAHDTRSRNRRQKPAPENWRRLLAHLSYNLEPNFSGARFWSRIEHVLFRDRIWRPRDRNTDL